MESSQVHKPSYMLYNLGTTKLTAHFLYKFVWKPFNTFCDFVARFQTYLIVFYLFAIIVGVIIIAAVVYHFRDWIFHPWETFKRTLKDFFENEGELAKELLRNKTLELVNEVVGNVKSVGDKVQSKAKDTKSKAEEVIGGAVKPFHGSRRDVSPATVLVSTTIAIATATTTSAFAVATAMATATTLSYMAKRLRG
ncbi:hypothetical protein CC80DRAFT_500887 [Byssothecium circinans]|uniref:Uncharacterized protein n=1 Tax=Byssothecium circinans TaxID=147558 RepID=A0A6A5U9C1_9PLEO|nr:hypothetical protein CC80DRAFT_500887 [Byssothecium circinans]